MPRFEAEQPMGPGRGDTCHWPAAMGAGHPSAPIFSPRDGEIMVVGEREGGRVQVFYENSDRNNHLDRLDMVEADFEELVHADDADYDAAAENE